MFVWVFVVLPLRHERETTRQDLAKHADGLNSNSVRQRIRHSSSLSHAKSILFMRLYMVICIVLFDLKAPFTGDTLREILPTLLLGRFVRPRMRAGSEELEQDVCLRLPSGSLADQRYTVEVEPPTMIW